MHDYSGVWWLVGVAGVALLIWGLAALNPEARLRRRLRKTHSRIVSKARKPMVRFNVRTPKKKKKK